MGTWSAFLACRAPTDAQQIWPDSQSWGTPAPGWAFVDIALSFDPDLDAALAAAPGPALTAIVCDSDFAHVRGAVDGVTQWEVFLNEKTAAEYDMPVPTMPGAEDGELHQRIGAWAAQAGSPTMDRAALQRVLAGGHVFADDALHELACVLGIMTSHSEPPPDGDNRGAFS
jgi:hypothetical protein